MLLDAIAGSGPVTEPVAAAMRALRDAIEPVGNGVGRSGPTAGVRPDNVPSLAARAMRVAAAEGPQIVVLEDIHHADATMLHAISTMVRICESVPLTVLLSMRRGYGERTAPVESFVHRRVPEGRGLVVDLPPLTDSEVEEFVRTRLDGDVPAQRREALTAEAVRVTRGYPLYLEAFLTAHREASGTSSASAPTGNRRESLEARLLGHDEMARTLVRALSVLPVVHLSDLGFVAQSTGLSLTNASEAFDRLVAAGILASRGSEFHFAQPLLQEEVYAALGVTERRSLHRAAAKHLQARGGRAADLLGWATHVVESTGVGEEEGISAAFSAARHVAPSAPLVAQEWLTVARERMRAGDPRALSLDSLRAGLLSYGGNLGGALTLGDSVIREVGIGPHSASVVRMHSMVLLGVGRHRDALDLLDRAEAAGVRDTAYPPIRAHALVNMGDVEKAHHALQHAALEEPWETETYISWLILRAFGTQMLGRDEREDLVAQLDFRCVSFGPLMEQEARAGLQVLAIEGAEGVRGARHQQDLLRELQGEDFTPALDSTQLLAQTEVAYVTGSWESALELADLAGEPLPESVFKVSRDGVRALGVLMLDDMDRTREAEAASRGLRARARSSAPLVAAAHARVLRAAGQTARAEDRLAEMIDEHLADGLPILLGLALEELVRLPGAAHDRTVARAIAVRDLLADLDWPVNEVHSRRALARLLAPSDEAGARREAEEAHARAVAEGMSAEVARCSLLLGELGVDPTHHLAQAYEAFREIGATRLSRQARTLMRSARIPVPRQRRKGARTGEMEREVARLAVEGLTNLQIAERLHYSVKTVELYLSRMYQRLGVAGRVELAGAVASGQLRLDE